MPTPIEYVGATVDADYCVTMSWDFKAKLSDLPPEGFKVEPEELGSMPLGGDWCLSLVSKADRVVVKIEHGGLAYAALGDRVAVTFSLAYFTDGTLRRIATGSCPARIPHPNRGNDGTAFTSYDYSLAKNVRALDSAAAGLAKISLPPRPPFATRRIATTRPRCPFN